MRSAALICTFSPKQLRWGDMKTLLLGAMVGGWLAAGTFLLHAQTNAPATNASAQQAVSFLTSAQQEQYAKARAQALTDNPTLKSEGETLMKQGESVMANGSAADKQGFIEKMNSHRQKLRAAMLKVDPTLEPIFAEIDKHISEMKAKQQAAGAK
jgi:hypothetical protein